MRRKGRRRQRQGAAGTRLHCCTDMEQCRLNLPVESFELRRWCGCRRVSIHEPFQQQCKHGLKLVVLAVTGMLRLGRIEMQGGGSTSASFIEMRGNEQQPSLTSSAAAAVAHRAGTYAHCFVPP